MIDKKRRKFIKDSSTILAMGLLAGNAARATHKKMYISKRPLPSERKFTSNAIEETIIKVKSSIKDKELAWLFENCFPNTLDTTVEFEWKAGSPDTYVITGDIDAMWLRDSTAQVFPYLPYATADQKLQQLIAGVINRQVHFILLDPYANAFYKDVNRVSEWKKTDLTEMKPGVHERKWEIDSLCYPLRLSYHYWKSTGDTSPFDRQWLKAALLIHQTFVQQQRKDDRGPYHFQRETAWATDGVPLGGYGYPTKPVGLICSMFRPSDDATIFPFLIPSNFFAVTSLRQGAELISTVFGDEQSAAAFTQLASEVESALRKYAITEHPHFGKVYAYETNGYGSYNLMDDANVPSLLAMPYLSGEIISPEVYRNTRNMILSPENPFFFSGKAGFGIGGPHTGVDMIWHLGIIMRGLTSADPEEIKSCLTQLQMTHGGTGFMHESFHKDDAAQFTRKWFAWANTLFGEFVLKVVKDYPGMI